MFLRGEKLAPQRVRVGHTRSCCVLRLPMPTLSGALTRPETEILRGSPRHFNRGFEPRTPTESRHHHWY